MNDHDEEKKERAKTPVKKIMYIAYVERHSREKGRAGSSRTTIAFNQMVYDKFPKLVCPFRVVNSSILCVVVSVECGLPSLPLSPLTHPAVRNLGYGAIP